MKRALCTAATLGLGVLALAGCSAQPAPAGGPSNGTAAGITVHGVGTVTGAPDVATIVLGVQTQAASANAALAANNQQANALISTLKSKGVADADLKTSQLSISPSYDPTGGRITGYQVTNQVTATVHNIAQAGGMIDAASQAAGDAIRVQQLSFSLDNKASALANARADAMRQARAQAEQLANAAGVHLGQPRSITENPTSTPPTPMYRDNLEGAAQAAPVQPGTQKLTVSVDVVYDID